MRAQPNDATTEPEPVHEPDLADEATEPDDAAHPTGDAQAEENRETDPPA